MDACGLFEADDIVSRLDNATGRRAMGHDPIRDDRIMAPSRSRSDCIDQLLQLLFSRPRSAGDGRRRLCFDLLGARSSAGLFSIGETGSGPAQGRRRERFRAYNASRPVAVSPAENVVHIIIQTTDRSARLLPRRKAPKRLIIRGCATYDRICACIEEAPPQGIDGKHFALWEGACLLML